METSNDAGPVSVHLFYKLFFLYIEPFSTIVGAIYAHFYPQVYLNLTHASSAPAINGIVPLATKISLTQLGNLYLLFALSEALVLRCTSDAKVWRAFLFCLLIADVGHLFSVSPLGYDIYWSFWTWNSIHWGNIGFVYVGAMTRTAFLLGLGVEEKGMSDLRAAARKAHTS